MTTTLHTPRLPVEVTPIGTAAGSALAVEAAGTSDPRKAVRSAPRVEIKAVVREFELPRFLAELRLSQQVLRPHHPTRTVQSIYLDTHDGRAMRDNLDGIRDREKVRFRWYGPHAGSARGTLERKIRSDRLGWKVSQALPVPIRIVGASRTEFTGSVREQAGHAFAEAFASSIGPALWVAYERDYFVSGNGKVRVTADRNLRSFDLRHAPSITDSRVLPMPRLAVLEFKAAPEDERLIDALLAQVPVLAHRCSKYVMAASPADGPLPSL